MEKMVGENRGILLVVDDTEPIRKSMSRQLSRIGYVIQTADSGAAALAALRKEPFDLAIIDYRMPEMNGLELFYKIKAESPYLPVIMITGEGSIDLALEFMKAGGTNFLVKPLKFERLNADIQQAIETVKLRREIDILKEKQDMLLGLLETINALGNQAAQKARNIYSIADELINPGNAKNTQQRIRTAAREVGQNIAAIVKSISVQNQTGKEEDHDR